MLEACLDLSLPVSVLERRLLVVRDLDLLQAINQKSVAVVLSSIIPTPDAPVRKKENLLPVPLPGALSAQ